MRDHPGGPDVLLDTAGTDATEAYEDVGHSEDANSLLETYLIGTLKGTPTHTRPKTVRVAVQQPGPQEPEAPKHSASSLINFAFATASIGGAAFSLYLFFTAHGNRGLHEPFLKVLPHWTPGIRLSGWELPRGGFTNGFTAASIFFGAITGVTGSKLSKLIQIDSDFAKYPQHIKSRGVIKSNPHLEKGFLDPKVYKSLPLVRKDTSSPNVYRFVFQLPSLNDAIGIPIGQHVAIKATINGEAVSRSYTPTSNNVDRGLLELVIKCYPDGLLTGQYLEKIQIGERVEFRGPKGAMRYNKGICKKIGMIAGGTGITPMYQLIRAICEDDRDTTEISLIYANRSEEDILMRRELETFARDYPKNLKIWYMLDLPPPQWSYGSGYVTPVVMQEKLPGPSPDTKIMLCGPPGMVNAAKKGLGSMGFQTPSAVAKMSDQIFCF